MKIKDILWQHRRDFSALFECEYCGFEIQIDNCYDDDNFHCNVIPQIECKECGKKAPDTYRPLTTKYPSWFNI